MLSVGVTRDDPDEAGLLVVLYCSDRQFVDPDGCTRPLGKWGSMMSDALKQALGCVGRVIGLTVVLVGVLAPSTAAIAAPAHSYVAPAVVPVDPPDPVPGPGGQGPEKDRDGEATPAPSDDSRSPLDGEYDGHNRDGAGNKGSEIPRALGSKLKSGKDESDDVAKKVAEKADEKAQSDNSSDDGGLNGLNPATWVKKGLETSATWIGDALGRAAAWVITSALAIAFGVGSPNLGADYIYTWTGRTFAAAIPITIALAFWQLFRTAIQARGLSGVRRAVAGAVAATAASMVTLPILVSLTAGVDELRSVMTGWLGMDVEKLSKQITDIFSLDVFSALAGVSPGAAAGGAAVMAIGFGFFCLFTIFFAIVLLFVMLLRGVFLQAATVVTPVAYSGLAADETRAWPRTVLGWLMALLVAPFGIVIVLGLGFRGLSELGEAKSITDALTQMATCTASLLGGLSCPWVSYKLFSFLGEDAVAAMVSQMRGAVVAGASTVGNTVKSVAGAASSPTEGGPIGQTVKNAVAQGTQGTTDGGGGTGGGETQGAAGEQQGQDEQKAKVAAAAAAVATGGASAAAGAGAGAAGSSGGAAASSSGAGGGAAGAGAEAPGFGVAGGSGATGSVAGAPAEGAGAMSEGATASGADGGAGGGAAPDPAPAFSGSDGGSVGSVAGAPAEGAGAMSGETATATPSGGGAFTGGAGTGGGGLAPPPEPASAGGGSGSVGAVAGAPPASYGYNPAPPPPPATTYSSSSLYGYNSPSGSGYGSYSAGSQGYRPPAPADDTDTAVFAIPGDADEPIGADAFVPADDPRYWEEM